MSAYGQNLNIGFITGRGDDAAWAAAGIEDTRYDAVVRTIDEFATSSGLWLNTGYGVF